LSVAGFIARLKVAVTDLPLLGTPLVLVVAAWSPLTGLDELTAGMVGPVLTHAAPGGIAPTGAPGMPARTIPPKIGSFASFQHPAIRATNTNGMDQMARLVTPSNLFILLPFFV